MNINDIAVGGSYLFSIPKTTAIFVDLTSPSFSAKYRWEDVNGKTVIIIAKRNVAKFYVEGDPIDCWGQARSECFMPLSSLQTKSTTCQCNLWLSGCKCGIFAAEQQPSLPKKRQWKYI